MRHVHSAYCISTTVCVQYWKGWISWGTIPGIISIQWQFVSHNLSWRTHYQNIWTDSHAGSSFSNSAQSNQTIALANSGNTTVDFNVSATPLGLVGGWIVVAPTTGVSGRIFAWLQERHSVKAKRSKSVNGLWSLPPQVCQEESLPD